MNVRTKNSEIGFGGVPYSLDVKRLREAFPIEILKEGTILTHESLAAVFDAPKGSGRYYGVISSWIRELKARENLFLVWEQTIGLKVLDPAAVLTHTESRSRQKLRQFRRVVKDLYLIRPERLDQIGQQRLDHQKRVLLAMAENARRAEAETSIELAPVKSLPRPLLVSNG